MLPEEWLYAAGRVALKIRTGGSGRAGILIETAKANNLRVYEYLEYLLDGLSRHANDKGREFIKDLLPWSEAAQKKCRSLKKS